MTVWALQLIVCNENSLQAQEANRFTYKAQGTQTFPVKSTVCIYTLILNHTNSSKPVNL